MERERKGKREGSEGGRERKGGEWEMEEGGEEEEGCQGEGGRETILCKRADYTVIVDILEFNYLKCIAQSENAQHNLKIAQILRLHGTHMR